MALVTSTYRRRIIAIMGALTLTLGLSGCGESSSGTEAGDADLRQITVGMSIKNMSPIGLNVYIGEQLGYFEQEGLTVEFLPLGSLTAVNAALDQGQVDIGSSVPVDVLPVLAKGEDHPAYSFAEYTYPFKWDVVVPRGSDLTGLSDLKGKKVGVPNLGGTYVPVGTRMLDLVGVAKDEVEFIAVGEGVTAGSALDQGQVDALVYDDTGFGQIESAGIALDYLPRPEGLPAVGGLYLAATRDYLKDNPEVIEGVIRAVAKSSYFARANPEAAAHAFLQMFPEAAPAGKSEPEQIKDVVGIIEKRLEIVTPSDDRKWGEMSEAEWAAEADFYAVDIDDVTQAFTNEFVDKANDFDIQAVEQEAKNVTVPN